MSFHNVFREVFWTATLEMATWKGKNLWNSPDLQKEKVHVFAWNFCYNDLWQWKMETANESCKFM